MKNNKVQSISVDIIDDPDEPMRTGCNEQKLIDLSNSIKNLGLINPIIVRPKNGRFEVVSGHRRLLAAKMANLPVVSCLVRNLDDLYSDIVKVHENLFRENVNTVDEALFFEKALKRLDLTIGGLARQINRSETYVKDRLAILNYDEKTVDALKSGKIKLSAAKYLTKIDDPRLRDLYVDFAVRGGITPTIARTWYIASKENRLPEEPTVKVVEDQKTGQIKKVQTVKCRICQGDVSVEHARLFFAHQECIDKISL